MHYPARLRCDVSFASTGRSDGTSHGPSADESLNVGDGWVANFSVGLEWTIPSMVCGGTVDSDMGLVCGPQSGDLGACGFPLTPVLTNDSMLPDAAVSQPLRIYTLGRFAVLRYGVPLNFNHKAPRKPLSLLKAIIALGARDVPQRKLIDAIWPDEDGDSARQDFDSALYRLRKLLADPNAIRMTDGLASLDTARAWVDALAFDDISRPSKEFDSADADAHDLTLLTLYRGRFLATDIDTGWTVPLRERLHSRFVQSAQRAGKRMELRKEIDKAIQWYIDALEIDDLAEPLYQGLMRCYLVTGRYAEGMAAYRRMLASLVAGLGVRPNRQSEALRCSLGAAAAAVDSAS